MPGLRKRSWLTAALVAYGGVVATVAGGLAAVLLAPEASAGLTTPLRAALTAVTGALGAGAGWLWLGGMKRIASSSVPGRVLAAGLLGCLLAIPIAFLALAPYLVAVPSWKAELWVHREYVEAVADYLGMAWSMALAGAAPLGAIVGLGALGIMRLDRWDLDRRWKGDDA